MPDLLLVDLGNTRLRWAAPGGLRAGEIGVTTHRGALDGGMLEGCWAGRPAPDRIVVANVAGPAAAAALTDWVRDAWALEPAFLESPPSACGVRNGYERPDQLGIDRFAALVGAYRAGLAPACVVDCGSAITVDLLTADGAHLGGYIAPGLAAMADALTAAAPGLPPAGGNAGSGPGRKTESAIAAGTRLAAAGLVERVLAESAEALGPAPNRVITGGDGPLLAADLPGPSHQVPGLVLQGLYALATEEGNGTDR